MRKKKRISKYKEKRILYLYIYLKLSVYKISKILKISCGSALKYLNKNNIELRYRKYDYSKKRNKKITFNDEKNIIYLYCNENKELGYIADLYKCHKDTIKRYLKKNNVKLRYVNGSHKGAFTLKEKRIIIKLYVKELRGKSYIAKLFNRSDNCISYWLKKWNIPNNSRSDISKKIRKIYGNTKGFSGHHHSKKSKQQISETLNKKIKNGDIKDNFGCPKTIYINTKIGKLLGSYEIAYIYKLILNNKKIPNINHKRLKTPYGSYKPDFEFKNKYIEIKSNYTIKMSKKTGQYKKIKWVNKYIKKVDILILNDKIAWKYFKLAVKNNFVLDNIKLSYNTYKIIK